MREVIRQKRLEFWKNLSWILHRDNAQDHTSILACEFLTKNKNSNNGPTIVSLGPADFFLFPKQKTPNKGKRFDTIEEIKEKSKQQEEVDTKKRVTAVFRRSQKMLA